LPRSCDGPLDGAATRESDLLVTEAAQRAPIGELVDIMAN
jgi:hypothetical protein